MGKQVNIALSLEKWTRTSGGMNKWMNEKNKEHEGKDCYTMTLWGCSFGKWRWVCAWEQQQAGGDVKASSQWKVHRLLTGADGKQIPFPPNVLERRILNPETKVGRDALSVGAFLQAGDHKSFWVIFGIQSDPVEHFLCSFVYRAFPQLI